MEKKKTNLVPSLSREELVVEVASLLSPHRASRGPGFPFDGETPYLSGKGGRAPPEMRLFLPFPLD